MTDEIESELVAPDDADEALVVPEDDDAKKPVYSKSTTQKIVEREKQKAFERGKREALMELQQQQAPEQQAPQAAEPQAPQQQGMGGMPPQMSQADIERMIAEKAPQALQAHVQQLQQDQMINSFVSKMQQAEQKYPGLEKELNNLNFNDPRIGSFIQMANSMENTGDIMKEVLDNPTKLESLLNMASNQPYQAQKAMASLSESIKTNQQAIAEETKARDPLNQVKPSANAGLADATQPSIRDLQRQLSQRR